MEERWRRRLAVVALAAPLVAIPLAGRAVADRLGARGGAALALALVEVQLDRSGEGLPPPVAAPAPEPAPLAGPEARPGSEAQAPCLAAAKKRCAGLGAARPAGQPALPRGLRIRAAVVASAVRSGARPSGTPVPPSGARPGGLAMYGVGQFGAGLRDGDVLTSIAGAPAGSVDVVVSAVLGALRKRAPVLSATVWRGEEPIQVAVELPQPRG
jgi:hypothetical protein